MISDKPAQGGVTGYAMAGLLIMLLLGCTQNPDKAPAPKPSESALQEQQPASKSATISIEGAGEPITLNLFRSDSVSRPAFSTYVPEDMIAEPIRTDAGDAVRFVANFGHKLEEEAYVEILFFPDGTDEAKARSIAAKSGKPDSAKRFGWSIAEYGISYRSSANVSISGVSALGQHGQRYFQITLHYPGEYSDGFPPRAYRILQEWRWGDTNQGL
jgi:hypothetical protein